jgi:hypothetical protein
MSNLIFQQQGSSPTQAGAGYSQLYAKTDGIVYQQVGTNTEVPIMSGTEVGLSMSEITSASSLSGSKVCTKAWINFDGTGTAAIGNSYNVASLTDNGAGDYTVNFATDITSAAYCAVGSSGAGATAAHNKNLNIYTQAAGSVRVTTSTTDNVNTDCGTVNVNVFGP